jgi:hypothetical protein
MEMKDQSLKVGFEVFEVILRPTDLQSDCG